MTNYIVVDCTSYLEFAELPYSCTCYGWGTLHDGMLLSKGRSCSVHCGYTHRLTAVLNVVRPFVGMYAVCYVARPTTDSGPSSYEIYNYIFRPAE